VRFVVLVLGLGLAVIGAHRGARRGVEAESAPPHRPKGRSGGVASRESSGRRVRLVRTLTRDTRRLFGEAGGRLPRSVARTRIWKHSFSPRTGGVGSPNGLGPALAVLRRLR
jgi:hypothetical protein